LKLRLIAASQSKHAKEAHTKKVKYHAIIMLKPLEIAGFWRHFRVALVRATSCTAFKRSAHLALMLAFLSIAPTSVEARAPFAGRDGGDTISISELPPQAQEVLRLIKAGGPFPYPKDGSVFGNRERRLPPRPSGYYREYTVPTPGSRDRGARRIIAGRNEELYYTSDHYRRFKRIVER
jgi:ribonuclease T1